MALAGEAERKGRPRGSGNRGPAGWITDPQGHGVWGNHGLTPEQRPPLQSEPSWGVRSSAKEPRGYDRRLSSEPILVPTLPSIKGARFHLALAPTFRALGQGLLESSAHVCRGASVHIWAFGDCKGVW